MPHRQKKAMLSPTLISINCNPVNLLQCYKNTWVRIQSNPNNSNYSWRWTMISIMVNSRNKLKINNQWQWMTFSKWSEMNLNNYWINLSLIIKICLTKTNLEFKTCSWGGWNIMKRICRKTMLSKLNLTTMMNLAS